MTGRSVKLLRHFAERALHHARAGVADAAAVYLEQLLSGLDDLLAELDQEAQHDAGRKHH